MAFTILYTYDYGIINHACDSGGVVSATFTSAQDAMTFCLNAIHQAYHPQEDHYEDSNICVHGHHVEFIIMEIARYNADPNGDPIVQTFDIFDNNITYNDMLQNFTQTQDAVNIIPIFFN